MGRRGFLVAAGTALASGTAVAADTSYQWDDGGDSISRTFDEDLIRKFLPRFDIDRTDLEQLIGVYAWVARSPDHDTDAVYVWLRYSHQDAAADRMGPLDRAVGVLASDAHLWDHEPSIIFIDSDTEDYESAEVTGYHHYPLHIPDDPTLRVADETGARTHVGLRVVPPWHHYRLADDTDDTADVTNLVELESFLDVRDSWERQDIFQNSNRLAIDNPWALKDGRVKSWWDEDSRDARAARLWHWLGLRGAGDADADVRFE